MIIGFDHITFNTHRSEQAIVDLKAQGYQPTFIEYDVNNPIEKTSLLDTYYPKHDLGQFKHPHTHFCIEFTNHHSLSNTGPPFSLEATHIKLQSAAMEKDALFFVHALTFQEKEGLFQLIRPFPQWQCTIELAPSHTPSCSTLDSPGFSCLAFISNHLEEDINCAARYGAHSMTPIFSMNVNQKNIRIVMCRTPSNAIIEFIQIHHKGKHHV